ncbi:MAG TPA: MMPL family transporter [Puia sp.]|nr:MMPL family transporter [Puia sp.]
MWESIARLVLRYRLLWLILLLSVTAFMAFHASKVQLSYDFTRTIPTDNPKYKEYQEFRRRFGDDGNLLVVAVQSDKLFRADVFADYVRLTERLKKVPGVDYVLGFSSAPNLIRDTATQTFKTVPIFSPPYTQARIDSGKAVLLGLPFYSGLLYNAQTNTWLTGVQVNKDVMNSKRRIETVGAITRQIDSFGVRQGITMHYSGLPLIRTRMAVRVARETTWFLLGSVLILSIILFLFFRSVSTVLMSLAVVVIGVVFALGTMDLLGYKITLLNALTPTLVVVIGIPNCIYFMNKYHTAFRDTGNKQDALILMIDRMGIVTLFCNLTAAIGFGVFALTRSAILNEFGVVAGINIMLLFFISIILIPAVLSYLPAPQPRQMRYLENRWLAAILKRLEEWAMHHRRPIYILTALVLVVSVAGMFRLQSEGFILDDLPKKDPMYTDLKFFEKNFKGVMPLEVVIDTRRRKGLRAGTVRLLDSVDQFSKYIASRPEMARPLSFVEGLKFVRQAYYGGDSSAYEVPNSADFAFLSQYMNGSDSTKKAGSKNDLTQLLHSFVDTNQQRLRISIEMADIGSKRLPVVLGELERKARALFDPSKYNVEFTGTSVTYLEGSNFVIKGLRDSIQWSFLLIAACMLVLFRSVRILVCSLVPNVIPLIVTAGIMGWAGVRLRPSTVIVFSIALGIAIDITIRFLVNYKQERPAGGAADGSGRAGSTGQAVVDTINKTGISIIYTSLVLIAGFVIFCFSDFGGILALGWLTSITLVIATLTNLVFLPVLLLTLTRSRQDRS